MSKIQVCFGDLDSVTAKRLIDLADMISTDAEDIANLYDDLPETLYFLIDSVWDFVSIEANKLPHQRSLLVTREDEADSWLGFFSKCDQVKDIINEMINAAPDSD